MPNWLAHFLPDIVDPSCITGS